MTLPVAHQKNQIIAHLASQSVGQVWLAALLISAVVFTAAPEIDITVSRFFFRDHFILSDLTTVDVFRRGLLWGAALPCVVALIAFSARLIRKPIFGFGPAPVHFTLLLHIVGPGMLVNGFLKQTSGRARPEYITDFGGTADFTPALLFADQCSGNCSFVSAETSALTASAISAFVLTSGVANNTHARYIRILSLIGLGTIGVLRMALGRHFLSDVVFAVLLTLGCAIALAHFFARQHNSIRHTAPATALSRLGRNRSTTD